MFSNPDKLKGNMINCGAYSQKQTCSNLIKLQMLYKSMVQREIDNKNLPKKSGISINDK